MSMKHHVVISLLRRFDISSLEMPNIWRCRFLRSEPSIPRWVTADLVWVGSPNSDSAQKQIPSHRHCHQSEPIFEPTLVARLCWCIFEDWRCFPTGVPWRQSAWSSSSGSGAAIGAYDWHDFTIGTGSKTLLSALNSSLQVWTLATGSSRRPAMANGCFQIRLSHDAISLEHVVPSFPWALCFFLEASADISRTFRCSVLVWKGSRSVRESGRRLAWFSA